MRKRMILIVLLLSVSFNIMAAIAVQVSAGDSGVWLFPELGPGIMQDSYYGRAPALEGLFGAIGDVPGGYSLYTGSPLQGSFDGNLSTWTAGSIPWKLSAPTSDTTAIIAAIALTALPLLVVFVVGRRSYGSTKTR